MLDDQSPVNLARRQRLYREACEASASLPWDTRTGRYGLWQRVDGQWQATGSLGYETEASANTDVVRRNRAQLGRWAVRDRHSSTSLCPPSATLSPSLDAVKAMMSA